MSMLDEIRDGEFRWSSWNMVRQAVYGIPEWLREKAEKHDAQDAAMLRVVEAAAEWVHWDDASDVFGERALEMRREAEQKMRDAVAVLTKEGHAT